MSNLDNIVEQKFDRIKEGNPGFDEKPNFIIFYNELKKYKIGVVNSRPDQIKNFNGFYSFKISDGNDWQTNTYLLIPNTVVKNDKDKEHVAMWFNWLNHYSSLPETINPKWNVPNPFANNRGIGGTNKRRTKIRRTKRRTNKRVKTNKRKR